MQAVCWLVLSSVLFAGDGQRPIEHQIPEEAQKAERSQEKQGNGDSPAVGASMTQVVVSLYIFGGIIVAAMILLCKGIKDQMDKANKDLSDPAYQQAFTAVLVLSLGAFLVVAGYSAAQMAGLFGIMGAIVGHVFSKRGSDKDGGSGGGPSMRVPPPS